MEKLKCLVKTFQDLPNLGNSNGDKRLVLFEKKVYEWSENKWIECNLETKPRGRNEPRTSQADIDKFNKQFKINKN